MTERESNSQERDPSTAASQRTRRLRSGRHTVSLCIDGASVARAEVVVSGEDAGADFGGHLGVLLLGVGPEGRGINRIEEADLEAGESLELLAAGPDFVEAFERDGDNRTLLVDSEEGGAVLEA